MTQQFNIFYQKLVYLVAAGVHSFPTKEGGIQVLAGLVAPFGQTVGTLGTHPAAWEASRKNTWYYLS